jgi:hypothetical protein
MERQGKRKIRRGETWKAETTGGGETGERRKGKSGQLAEGETGKTVKGKRKRPKMRDRTTETGQRGRRVENGQGEKEEAENAG